MKLTFENGAFCFINGEDITIGNGKDVDAYILSYDDEHYLKAEGYLMLDPQESYLDICVSFYDENGSLDECVVDDHLALIKVEFDDGYDQDFVEKFHPDYYHSDEIAWLDDCECALHNEVGNDAHWNMLAKEIVTDELDEAICYDIYCRRCGMENDDNPDFVNPISKGDEGKFGELMSIKYKDTLIERIAYYEDGIMDCAIYGFYRDLNIEEPTE